MESEIQSISDQNSPKPKTKINKIKAPQKFKNHSPNKQKLLNTLEIKTNNKKNNNSNDQQSKNNQNNNQITNTELTQNQTTPPKNLTPQNQQTKNHSKFFPQNQNQNTNKTQKNQTKNQEENLQNNNNNQNNSINNNQNNNNKNLNQNNNISIINSSVSCNESQLKFLDKNNGENIEVKDDDLNQNLENKIESQKFLDETEKEKKQEDNHKTKKNDFRKIQKNQSIDRQNVLQSISQLKQFQGQSKEDEMATQKINEIEKYKQRQKSIMAQPVAKFNAQKNKQQQNQQNSIYQKSISSGESFIQNLKKQKNQEDSIYSYLSILENQSIAEIPPNELELIEMTNLASQLGIDFNLEQKLYSHLLNEMINSHQKILESLKKEHQKLKEQQIFEPKQIPLIQNEVLQNNLLNYYIQKYSENPLKVKNYFQNQKQYMQQTPQEIASKIFDLQIQNKNPSFFWLARLFLAIPLPTNWQEIVLENNQKIYSDSTNYSVQLETHPCLVYLNFLQQTQEKRQKNKVMYLENEIIQETNSTKMKFQDQLFRIYQIELQDYLNLEKQNRKTFLSDDSTQASNNNSRNKSGLFANLNNNNNFNVDPFNNFNNNNFNNNLFNNNSFNQKRINPFEDPDSYPQWYQKLQEQLKEKMEYEQQLQKELESEENIQKIHKEPILQENQQYLRMQEKLKTMAQNQISERLKIFDQNYFILLERERINQSEFIKKQHEAKTSFKGIIHKKIPSNLMDTHIMAVAEQQLNSGIYHLEARNLKLL
ncbi:hypothetical protein PPERSA_10967 [Pseudocohnilembus persalinus]|uniref:Uncharacterized protein n=1 Tax=Pseudocohnilembus persalinus TaxID=266149 RepID=A0A0V0QCB5_PSEPJ|nr:hypothetical protein PPERSA_10967 [Pseudocohnilembus persalinus]|eukprot:KRW99848.1 hypothetical protein PPERSA_10967 [Pseudocohnilembus persalinus]